MARIVLIEPDRVAARHYKETLLSHGHQVTVCRTGQGGIQAADEQTPELVILELQLQGHNGIEFLYEFRSYPEWQVIPVLVHSLVPPQAINTIATAPLLAITRHLYKPETTLERLIETTEEMLETAVV